MTSPSLEISMEDRLLAMEAAIAELQKQVAFNRTPGNWLEHITGSFKDDPVFEEILRYGREYRESNYPDYCQPEA